jgi:hypothetical protein
MRIAYEMEMDYWSLLWFMCAKSTRETTRGKKRKIARVIHCVTQPYLNFLNITRRCETKTPSSIKPLIFVTPFAKSGDWWRMCLGSSAGSQCGLVTTLHGRTDENQMTSRDGRRSTPNIKPERPEQEAEMLPSSARSALLNVTLSSFVLTQVRSSPITAQVIPPCCLVHLERKSAIRRKFSKTHTVSNSRKIWNEI